MLDLQPRVHLEEIEVAARPDDEFDRPGALVADGLGERHRLCAHRGARPRVEERRRRLLHDLLVAPLDGAFALAQMDDVAMRVAEHLDFDVARRLDEFLQEHALVAEGGARLRAGALEAFARLLFTVSDAHALAAAAGRRLDHHRIADGIRDLRRLIGVGDDPEMPRHRGDTRLGRRLLRFDLVAHGLDRRDRRADEHNACRFERVGESSVLGKKSVARMHGLRAGLLRRRNDRLDGEIALRGRGRTDRHGLVRHLDMQRVAVRLRIDCDGGDPHPPRCAHHADRDLASVGDQDLLEHAERSLAEPRGAASVFTAELERNAPRNDGTGRNRLLLRDRDPRLQRQRRDPRLGRAGAHAALAVEDIGARADDDGDAEPLHRARKISEHEIAEKRRADDLDILHRRDQR